MVSQEPYEDARPNFKSDYETSPAHTGAEARLWEDPLNTAKSHYSLINRAVPFPNELEGDFLPIAVMTFGGSYDELIERRLRDRYAILSALNTAGYVPTSSETIRYFTHECSADQLDEKTSLKPKALQSMGLPAVIPYEILKNVAKPRRLNTKAPAHVLLLWLEDEIFNEQPLHKLLHLQESITTCLKNNGAKQFPEKFIVQGPAGSNTLQGMARELDGLNQESLNKLQNLEIFSPKATVDFALLHKAKKCETADNLSECFNTLMQREKNDPSIFLRTVSTDFTLMKILRKELAARGVAPECDEEGDCNQHIAIFAEWDSLYGRSMPCLFVAAIEQDSADKCSPNQELQNKLRAGGPAGIPWLHLYDYLRGIDGRLPDKRAAGSAAMARQNKKPSGDAQSNIEKPFGRSQYDYIRAQVTNLSESTRRKNLRADSKLRAIGILGSDTYDKLLMIQAIRERFPGVIIFTTDIRSLFLHPAHNEDTRNLLVASSFGLTLNPKTFGSMPVFRDAYQSSQYFSILCYFSEECRMGTQKKLFHRIGSRVYEIGRGRAFDLTDIDATSEHADAEQNPAAESLVIHPSSSHANRRMFVHLLSPTAGFVLLIITLGWIGYQFETNGDDEQSLIRERKNFYKNWSLILAIVTAIWLAFLFAVNAGSLFGEPVSMTGGVSIWPTEFIRAIAVLTTMLLLKHKYERISETQKRINGYFYNENGGKKQGADESTEFKIWQAHLERAGFKAEQTSFTKLVNNRRVLRTLSYAVVFWLFGFATIFSHGEPFVPYRGSAAKLVDIIVIFSASAFLSYLVMSVVDTLQITTLLMKKLRACDLSPSPLVLNPLSKEVGLSPDVLGGHWVKVKLIEKYSGPAGDAILYPVVIVFILIISRLPYFDNWITPPGLEFVLLAMLGLISYRAYQFREAAKTIQQDALRYWETKLTEATAHNEKNSGANETQARLVLEHLRSVNGGAFRPFRQQPLVKAFALLFGGGGSILLLEALKFLS